MVFYNLLYFFYIIYILKTFCILMQNKTWIHKKKNNFFLYYLNTNIFQYCLINDSLYANNDSAFISKKKYFCFAKSWYIFQKIDIVMVLFSLMTHSPKDLESCQNLCPNHMYTVESFNFAGANFRGLWVFWLFVGM